MENAGPSISHVAQETNSTANSKKMHVSLTAVAMMTTHVVMTDKLVYQMDNFAAP